MDYEFSHRPSYTHLTVSFQQGKSIIAEPDAMVGHSTTVTVETETSRDGLLSSAKSMLGGALSSSVSNEQAVENGRYDTRR